MAWSEQAMPSSIVAKAGMSVARREGDDGEDIDDEDIYGA
jgi:hypothetical protein